MNPNSQQIAHGERQLTLSHKVGGSRLTMGSDPFWSLMDQNRKIHLPVGVLPESVDSSLCNSADLQFLWLAVQDQQWVNLDLKVQRSINAPMEASKELSRSLACKNNFFDVIIVKLLWKAEVNRLNSFEALSLTQCAVWPLWSWHHMTTYYSINTIVRSFFFQVSLHLMLNYDKTVIRADSGFLGNFFVPAIFGHVDILYSISSSLVRLW